MVKRCHFEQKSRLRVLDMGGKSACFEKHLQCKLKTIFAPIVAAYNACILARQYPKYIFYFSANAAGACQEKLRYLLTILLENAMKKAPKGMYSIFFLTQYMTGTEVKLVKLFYQRRAQRKNSFWRKNSSKSPVCAFSRMKTPVWEGHLKSAQNQIRANHTGSRMLAFWRLSSEKIILCLNLCDRRGRRRRKFEQFL